MTLLPPNRRGLTLMELMIVLVIVAALIVGAVVLFNDLTRANLKAQTLRVSGVIKYAYGQAAIRQEYHQLVIDLDSSEYWLEVSDQENIGGPPQLPAPSLIGAPQGGATSSPATRAPGYDSDDPEGSVFGLQRPGYREKSDLVVKRRKLENGISFRSVLTTQSQDPITSGRATITFFPSGFVERSQIVLGDASGAFMTMQIEPLTGKVNLLSGDEDIPRGFFEVEEAD